MNVENRRTQVDKEYQGLMKIINFRFSHKFKNIGVYSAVFLLVFLIGYKYYGGNNIIVKDVLRTLMLFFMLIASLSKDAFEDEYVNHVRSQSHVLASICAIAYSIGLPLVALLLDFVITKITNGEGVSFHEVSAFEVMFMLLGFQLLFFEALKRLGRAQ